ncbi:MAG: diacylglycerol kinase [Chloroflexota bacterium]|jgi:diacylglycerol kinase (ATP)|nr:diacylglycerol kinase [Chloroflexota bacterium]
MTAAARPRSQGLLAGRVLVVWNPTAGSKAGLPTNGVTEDELRATMRAAGLGDDLFVGETEDAARRRIRAAVDSGVEVIVAAGGDGTAGLVAEAIVGTPAALGILPLGSAMNIARSLGIPREISAAADILVTGEIATVDVGRASDGLFFEMASVGINAAVLGEAHKLAEGSYRSILGLLRAIIVYRPATMTIELDDETVRTGALMIVIANTPFTGAGLTLAPDARMDDGLFDVAVYRHFSRWELIRHGLSIIAGRRSYSPKVRTYRSATVRIDSRRPLPARADARDLGTTPLELKIVPRALRVIVPRSTDRTSPDQGGPALID